MAHLHRRSPSNQRLLPSAPSLLLLSPCASIHVRMQSQPETPHSSPSVSPSHPFGQTRASPSAFALATSWRHRRDQWDQQPRGVSAAVVLPTKRHGHGTTSEQLHTLLVMHMHVFSLSDRETCQRISPANVAHPSPDAKGCLHSSLSDANKKRSRGCEDCRVGSGRLDLRS